MGLGKPDALKKKDTVVNAGQKPQTTRPSGECQQRFNILTFDKSIAFT